MKNLIRSKEEQIRKQEAEIAMKTHEIQSSPSRRDRHIFYKKQPVQRVICGSAICSGGSRGGARGARASPALFGVKKEELERLSLTFTANGKRQK